MPLRDHDGKPKVRQPLDRAHQIDEGFDTAVVLGHVALVDREHHRTARCEVEGHVVSDDPAGADRDRGTAAPILDRPVPDLPGHKSLRLRGGVGHQPPADDGGEVVHVREMHHNPAGGHAQPPFGEDRRRGGRTPSACPDSRRRASSELTGDHKCGVGVGHRPADVVGR
jgi:hypothetical protein